MLLKYTMMCLNRWSVSPELLKFCFLSALLALCSCQDQPASVDQRGSEDREPVVSVGQDTLYEANLAAMTTNFEAQREDEARLREEYIDRWIKRKLVYQKALDNLSPQQKDKDQALQRYYETLIRHTYQQSLLRQKLDQELSTDTLKAYYEANQSRFQLSAPVLKIRYLAVPPSAPDQSKLTDWFQSDKNYHLDSLYRYAKQHAQHFSLGNDQWQYYPEVRERFKLPAQAEPFLTNNQTHQTSLGDTANLHMGIKTYKLKNTTAPFPLKEQQVREALLNQRKKALFNEMEEEAIQEGLQQDKVQRYD